MATYSSILVETILWTEEDGRLQPRGSQRATEHAPTCMPVTGILQAVTIIAACPAQPPAGSMCPEPSAVLHMPQWTLQKGVCIFQVPSKVLLYLLQYRSTIPSFRFLPRFYCTFYSTEVLYLLLYKRLVNKREFTKGFIREREERSKIIYSQQTYSKSLFDGLAFQSTSRQPRRMGSRVSQALHEAFGFLAPLARVR